MTALRGVRAVRRGGRTACIRKTEPGRHKACSGASLVSSHPRPSTSEFRIVPLSSGAAAPRTSRGSRFSSTSNSQTSSHIFFLFPVSDESDSFLGHLGPRQRIHHHRKPHELRSLPHEAHICLETRETRVCARWGCPLSDTSSRPCLAGTDAVPEGGAARSF